MPKNNRFNPTALQRVQQAYGAWTPASPKRGPYASPAWKALVSYNFADLQPLAHVNISRILEHEGMHSWYDVLRTNKRDQNNAVACRALKAWKAQGGATDAVVPPMLKEAADWFARTSPGPISAVLHAAAARGEGLVWLDAYIALLED